MTSEGVTSENTPVVGAENAVARKEWKLETPSEQDLAEIGEIKALGFAEKGLVAKTEGQVYEEVFRTAPQKIDHIRVVRDESGMILGAIQLQLPGDPGDLSVDEDMRHVLVPGECYLEWIACRPEATGKGIGSVLMKW